MKSKTYYKVEIKTPGVVVQLPHNSRTIRTPVRFAIDGSAKPLVEAMCRVRGINNFTINEIEEDEYIEMTKPSDAKVPKLSLKRQRLGINVGGNSHGTDGKPTF